MLFDIHAAMNTLMKVLRRLWFLIQISSFCKNTIYSSKIISMRNTTIYNYEFKDFLSEKIKI